MDIGQIDKSEGEDEDVSAVQQRRPHDRSNQKHKQESDNERKPFNRRTANSPPSAPRCACANSVCRTSSCCGIHRSSASDKLHRAIGECFSPAPEVSYAAPAPVVEYISSDPAVYAAPASIMEYIAPAGAGCAGPAPDEEKYFISTTRLEEENYAALMIQRGWRWSRKRIVIRATSEERLQEKLRQVRRRLVAHLPVGASAKKRTESLKDMRSTLKDVEKKWRKFFNEELANVELDVCVRSGRVEW